MASILCIGAPGSPSPPTFEQPFEMLDACHDRVRRMLGLLGKLQAHVAEHGAGEQARDAARDVMRYFDLAAPQHHLDEELHVFPRLEAHADPAVRAAVARLRADHGAMKEGWAAARDVLQRLQAGQLQALDDVATRTLRGFAALYDGHLRVEEELAFPAAASAMEPDALRAMGEEMGRRRGVR